MFIFFPSLAEASITLFTVASKYQNSSIQVLSQIPLCDSVMPSYSAQFYLLKWKI